MSRPKPPRTLEEFFSRYRAYHEPAEVHAPKIVMFPVNHYHQWLMTWLHNSRAEAEKTLPLYMKRDVQS